MQVATASERCAVPTTRLETRIVQARIWQEGLLGWDFAQTQLRNHAMFQENMNLEAIVDLIKIQPLSLQSCK